MTSSNGNFSALLALCAGNSQVTSEFHLQRPVTRSFGIFIDVRLNKQLSKQSWGWWFEMPSRSLWRHRNAMGIAEPLANFFLMRTWLYPVGRAKVNQSKTVQTQSNLNRLLNYTINQKPLTLKKIYEYTLTWKYSSFRNRNIPHPPAYSALLHWCEGYYTTFRVSKKKIWSTQDNKSRDFTKNNIPNQAK